METYKLSIKNRIPLEGEKPLCAVCVNAPSLKYERLYDPNAKPKSLNYDSNEFDTSFSIVHPFRNVAAEVVRNHLISTCQSEMPRIEYVHDPFNNGFNEQRQKLFENILSQEYQKLREQVKQQEAIHPWR